MRASTTFSLNFGSGLGVISARRRSRGADLAPTVPKAKRMYEVAL